MKSIAFFVGAAGLFAVAHAHDPLHQNHDHAHAADCGHAMIAHAGHVDFLHDGHLHHLDAAHVDEHVLSVNDANPAAERLVAHADDGDHRHAARGDDHPTVQHGDHVDFIHNGRLHHVHDDHVDDHGPVTVMANG